MIKFVIGAGLVIFLVLLVFGGLTGRVRPQNGCCCPPDPERDLRMRDQTEGSEEFA